MITLLAFAAGLLCGWWWAPKITEVVKRMVG